MKQPSSPAERRQVTDYVAAMLSAVRDAECAVNTLSVYTHETEDLIALREHIRDAYREVTRAMRVAMLIASPEETSNAPF